MAFSNCNSNVDHITMKEQARQQRAQAASEWQKKNPAVTPAPLFDPPRQRRYSNDPIHQQCNSVLGNFDEARPFVYSASSFGASFQPMTPRVQGLTPSDVDPLSRFVPSEKTALGRPNGLNRNATVKRSNEPVQGIFDKFDVSGVVNAGQVKQERTASLNVVAEGTRHSRTAEIATKPVIVKKEIEATIKAVVVKKEIESTVKPVVVKKEVESAVKPLAVKKEWTGKEPSKGTWSSKDKTDKSSHPASVGADVKNSVPVVASNVAKVKTSNDVGSVKPSEDRHCRERSESRVAVAPPVVLTQASVTPKRFQSPKRIQPFSSSSQGLTPKKQCTKLHNGVVMNGISKQDGDVGADDNGTNTKVKLLKLKIANPSKSQAANEDPVEEVFREMRLHPPLTAIDTPRKEKKFPFTASTNESAVTASTVEASTKMLTKRKSHDGTTTAKVRRVSSVGNLEKDLVLSSDSESSDEEQEPTTGAPSGKVVAGKAIPDRAVRRATSNKMSSETSESESSDDDDASSSSNSEGEVGKEELKMEEGEEKKSVKEEPVIPQLGGAGSMQSKWNLENFIPKEKVGGIMAEVAATPLPNMSEPDSHHLNELCHNIINNSWEKSPLSPLDTIIQRSDCAEEGACVERIKQSPLTTSLLDCGMLQSENSKSTSTPKHNGELTPKGSTEGKHDSCVKRDLFNTPRRAGKSKKDDDKKRSGEPKAKREVSLLPAPDKSHSARRQSADKKPLSGSKPRHAGKRAAGKSPRSKEFLSSSSDSSDNDETSFVDVVGISSPEKDKHDRTPVCRNQTSGKVAPKVELKFSPKKADVFSLDLKDVFTAPLLSPIPNTDNVPADSKQADNDATSRSAFGKFGISYVDGRPSIMVCLKCSIFKTESPVSVVAGDGVIAKYKDTSLAATRDSSQSLQLNPKLSDVKQSETHNNITKIAPHEKANHEKLDSVSVPKEGCKPVNDMQPPPNDANGCAERTGVVNDAVSADSKPGKNPGAVEKKKRPMPIDILAQFSNGDAPRPLPKMKIPKRKPEVSSNADSQQDSSKRPRTTDASLSPRHTSDDVVDQESTSHKDDHAWDRKHPRRSDRPPGGGSTGSNISSQAAVDVVDSRYGSRSSERDRSERDRPERDRSERDQLSHRDGRDWEHHKTRTDWDAPSDASENQCDSPVRYRPTNCHGNQYQKVGSDWGAMAAGQIDTYSDHDRHPRGSYSPYSNGSSHYRPTHHTRDVGTRMSPKRKCCHRVEPVEDKLRSATYYLDFAKKLKHQADSTTEALAKFLTYIEAGIYFIQWCFAVEREHTSDTGRIFCMYNDTLKLIKHKYSSRSSHEPGEIHDKEAKLTVLSLRMQSILCLKLFQLKRAEMNRLKKVIDEYKSGTSKTSHVQVPSPYQANSANWSRTTGTPSPMSPQQSPAGSVGSVSSVGSGSGDHGVSKMMNGNHNPSGSGGSGGSSMAPATVSVPQRIHSVTQQYLGIMNYLSQSHDIWDQADLKAREYKDFFTSLNTDCGQLTMQSSLTEFARYIKVAAQRIKAT